MPENLGTLALNSPVSWKFGNLSFYKAKFLQMVRETDKKVGISSYCCFVLF
jgi:hypothetical protein